MRILHVIDQCDIGGTEKTAYIFCAKLKELGHHVSCFSFAGGRRERQFSESGIELYINDKPEYLNQIIVEENCDIVHMHRGGWEHNKMLEPIVFARKEMDKKFKIVETNIFGDVDRGIYGKEIDLQLFVSEYLLNWHKRATDCEEPNSIQKDFLHNPILVSNEPANLRRQLSIPTDAIVIGRCGRPDNYDGISIRALKRLRDEGFKVYYVALCPPEGMLSDLEQDNFVRFIREPIINESGLNKFYQTLNVFAHDRVDGETFGCCIAEAMMNRVPVVTHISSKYQGQIETLGSVALAKKTLNFAPKRIKFDGGIKVLDYGYVVEKDNDEAYADAIVRAFQNYLKELAYNPMQYTAGSLVLKLKRFYEDLFK